MGQLYTHEGGNCRCYCLRKVGCRQFSAKMKVLCVVAIVLVLGLQESSGMVLGGVGALPPTYVRSAEFANSLGSPITVEVTLESQKTKMYTVQAGSSVNVEGVIDHGSWTAVDPITSFKVMSASNGEKVVSVSSPFGIQRHRYEVGGGAANGLEITKTTM